MVINMTLHFDTLAISVLMFKVCLFVFLPKVLFISGYVSWNEPSESTYWKSPKNSENLKKFIFQIMEKELHRPHSHSPLFQFPELAINIQMYRTNEWLIYEMHSN